MATGSRVHLALSAFSCHMAAQPAAIHVWGMDRCARSVHARDCASVEAGMTAVILLRLGREKEGEQMRDESRDR